MSFKEVMRQSVVTTARSWVGTPWRHRGRAKRDERFGGGVDCAGLIMEIGNGLGLFNEPMAFQFYSRLPSGEFVRQACEAYLTPKLLKDKLPGDILLLSINNETRHLGLYTDSNTLIHAYAPNKQVVEQALDEEWRQRLVAVYSYPKLASAI